MSKAFSILIPNYNGAVLLETYLPSVLEAASSNPGPFEVVIVDDESTDKSVDLIRDRFPRVVVHRNERNVGFGETVNRGMSRCKHPIVVLLNNDVRVEKDFFGPLLRHFTDDRIFAVVARGLIVQDGVVKNESVTKFEFKNGFLNLIQPGLLHPEETFDTVCTVAHACGGFSALDREKFLALGGFDGLYAPFYWEDVDLSYRAWKRGWSVLYEPGSVAHHQCHATIDKSHRRAYIDMLHVRNRLLFTWKNLSDHEMITEHAHAMNRYIKSASEPFKQAFYEALKKMEEILQRRAAASWEMGLSDREVISLSSNHLVRNGSWKK
jgi:GT2 family glycosyltransferase